MHIKKNLGCFFYIEILAVAELSILSILSFIVNNVNWIHAHTLKHLQSHHIAKTKAKKLSHLFTEHTHSVQVSYNHGKLRSGGVQFSIWILYKSLVWLKSHTDTYEHRTADIMSMLSPFHMLIESLLSVCGKYLWDKKKRNTFISAIVTMCN